MITWKGTKEELLRRLAALPVLLGSSGGRDATALSRALGVEMLSIVKAAFVEKGRGGTDEAGIVWKPLSPAYVAYRRRHPGLNQKRGRAAKAGRGSRPLLTAKQDALWRSVYARVLRQGKDGGTAAKIAWTVVKAAGGKTIIGQYGGAQVEIGRDTGRLLASLGPGGTDNVLDAQPGGVRVGTNVKYAKHFHALRPMWPDDPAKFPKAWTDRLAGVMADVVNNILTRIIGGRP